MEINNLLDRKLSVIDQYCCGCYMCGRVFHFEFKIPQQIYSLFQSVFLFSLDFVSRFFVKHKIQNIDSITINISYDE